MGRPRVRRRLTLRVNQETGPLPRTSATRPHPPGPYPGASRPTAGTWPVLSRAPDPLAFASSSGPAHTPVPPEQPAHHGQAPPYRAPHRAPSVPILVLAHNTTHKKTHPPNHHHTCPDQHLPPCFLASDHHPFTISPTTARPRAPGPYPSATGPGPAHLLPT